MLVRTCQIGDVGEIQKPGHKLVCRQPMPSPSCDGNSELRKLDDHVITHHAGYAKHLLAQMYVTVHCYTQWRKNVVLSNPS
jgi:hypothetical protein